jgi:hypothetical protein
MAALSLHGSVHGKRNRPSAHAGSNVPRLDNLLVTTLSQLPAVLQPLHNVVWPSNRDAFCLILCAALTPYAAGVSDVAVVEHRWGCELQDELSDPFDVIVACGECKVTALKPYLLSKREKQSIC